MDDLYLARLSSTPHPPGKLPSPAQENDQNMDDIHINAQAPPGSFNPAGNGGAGQPIPIQLPNIYVNPFPPAAEHQHTPETGTRHRDVPDINMPTVTPVVHGKKGNTIKIGPWRFAKPHPLLWLCLGMSVVALVLGVPKGSLPTLTGRHKAIRVRLCVFSRVEQGLPPMLCELTV